MYVSACVAVTLHVCMCVYLCARVRDAAVRSVAAIAPVRPSTQLRAQTSARITPLYIVRTQVRA